MVVFRKFIDKFLIPFFEKKIHSCSDEIQTFNVNALEQLGDKCIKLSEVKFTCNTGVSCHKCGFSSANE